MSNFKKYVEPLNAREGNRDVSYPPLLCPLLQHLSKLRGWVIGDIYTCGFCVVFDSLKKRTIAFRKMTPIDTYAPSGLSFLPFIRIHNQITFYARLLLCSRCENESAI